MAETIGTMASTLAGSTSRAIAASAPTAKVTEEFTATTQSQVQPVSPTLRVDPIAGVVITEYFNSSGEVQTQFPSKAAVAYMRVGLSPTGTPSEAPKEASAQPVDQTQTEFLA